MHNSKIKSLSKKIVSLLAASAVTCSQFTAVTPIKAAETEEPISNNLSGSLCGDADSDGIIDEADSTLIEEYLLTGADSSIDMIAADTDGDNKITLRDAELILQHTQGIVSSLPFTGEIEWKNTGVINASSSSSLIDVYGKLTIYGGTFNGNEKGNDSATIGINQKGCFSLYGGTVNSSYSNPLSLRTSSGVTELAGGTLNSTSNCC